MSSVFISGSMSISELPKEVKTNIDNIIRQNMHILVGDACGIDSAVQSYCKSMEYENVTVFTIHTNPRHNSGYQSKVPVPESVCGTRNRQTEKDKAMSDTCNYFLAIWDGKSKGTHANIVRLRDKPGRVYIYSSKLS
jgi:hypothetical protein